MRAQSYALLKGPREQKLPTDVCSHGLPTLYGFSHHKPRPTVLTIVMFWLYPSARMLEAIGYIATREYATSRTDIKPMVVK